MKNITPELLAETLGFLDYPADMIAKILNLVEWSQNLENGQYLTQISDLTARDLGVTLTLSSGYTGVLNDIQDPPESRHRYDGEIYIVLGTKLLLLRTRDTVVVTPVDVEVKK